MKTYASLIFAHLCFTAPLWSQPPLPKLSADVTTGYVTVDGGPHPGRVAYKAGMKLLEALEAAGGGGSAEVDSITKNYRVHLIRGHKAETFSLNRLRAKPEEEPVLQSGDVVSFPQTVL